MMKNNNLKNEKEILHQDSKDNLTIQLNSLSEAIAYYEENYEDGDEDDDSQTDISISPNANHADKAKYQLCDGIFDIQIRHELSDKETAKRLNISEEIVNQINHHHYHKFTYEELSNYAQKLAESVEEEIVTENKYIKSYQYNDHQINFSSSKSNDKTISMI
ncbi:MAG: hypothetical protein AM1032_000331 [Mycoplasmataceae bacterium]|nr:MAG: hypothetical protein AM1032_000331 [Mycoplasmataceae bacterium]